MKCPCPISEAPSVPSEVQHPCPLSEAPNVPSEAKHSRSLGATPSPRGLYGPLGHRGGPSASRTTPPRRHLSPQAPEHRGPSAPSSRPAESSPRDFNERCAQCSEVNWGLTDGGRFYCRSCHNVTEATREVVNTDFLCNTRVQTISKGLRKKEKKDGGYEWYVCEGFQLVLKKQAEALEALGVCPQMKDEILCTFWRCYLQKSNQAYCNRPAEGTVKALSVCNSSTDVDSEPERSSLQFLSVSESEGDLLTDCSFVSSASKISESTSVCSGSVDGNLYLMKNQKEKLRMTMPMTLSFCYMALLWLREPMTLSDLLRFVVEGHIPYLNVFQHFPEKMKLHGVDLKIFCVESWPAYEEVYNKMLELAAFLDLPRFPDITDSCFLHPDMLCMKYLMEANLPDELHNWTCRVVKKICIGEVDFLTLVPGNKSTRKVKYDVLAAAVIVVVLKLLFLLDDNYEWLLSDFAEERNKNNKEGSPYFEFKKWYKVIKCSLDVKQKKLDEENAKHLWRCEKPLFYSAEKKARVLKRRHMVVNLQNQFGKLSGSVQPAEKPNPSSFQLSWSEENTDGSCFHGHSLKGILQEKCGVLTAMNSDYWLCTLKLCTEKLCGHLAHYREVDFPQSYHFVLKLFSFLLRIQPSYIHDEIPQTSTTCLELIFTLMDSEYNNLNLILCLVFVF
ncbi:TATA box-binding protein-associated factor RNA polymerase I subunit B isoform X1 [Falco naumanni]|uniref:TATA box-binding protein-associated factor RNA polymerase I subunit B isoform X1 n=1 Tax=Falco naumanni TaxID=148594 RepID=UPI001ADE73AA|nr:TATA box-binding protein-associated factor RNA polymerase I subunit B isoform X1 [Falco naumanni]